MKQSQYRRQRGKAGSNNLENNRKNICALEVAKYLGVDGTVHYLHYMGDIVRAARNKYTVRSRLSSVGGRKNSVGKIRSKLAKEKGLYIVGVDGHVILMNSDGKTLVDTAPRKRDQRKITHCYIVY